MGLLGGTNGLIVTYVKHLKQFLECNNEINEGMGIFKH